MGDSPKERIDVLLVEKGLAPSREKAKRIIMAGLVFVENQRVDKPGTQVFAQSSIEVKGNDHPFVSRGGLKLEKALQAFEMPVKGRIWLDIGASTGGFTHCLLTHEAAKVYSIDVGYGQLAWELRQDPRVVVMERTNIRHLKREALADDPQGAVIDVSFISLKLVLPAVVRLLASDSPIVALIKPQFEVGKGKVGKKGVVREISLHQEVLWEVLQFAETQGLQVQGLDFSPITGPEGNIEFLTHLVKKQAAKPAENLAQFVEDTTRKAHKYFEKSR